MIIHDVITFVNLFCLMLSCSSNISNKSHHFKNNSNPTESWFDIELPRIHNQFKSVVNLEPMVYLSDSYMSRTTNSWVVIDSVCKVEFIKKNNSEEKSKETIVVCFGNKSFTLIVFEKRTIGNENSFLIETVLKNSKDLNEKIVIRTFCKTKQCETIDFFFYSDLKNFKYLKAKMKRNI